MNLFLKSRKIIADRYSNELKDIKELFKTFEGGNGKGKFFNPYAIEKRGIEQKNNSNQQNPSNVNNNEEDDA